VKLLDTYFWRAYLAAIAWNRSFPARRSTRTFNPNDGDPEQQMGSTTFGSDGSTGVGLAMPQDIKDQSRRLSPREGYGRA
jgi:hypothetical protein